MSKENSDDNFTATSSQSDDDAESEGSTYEQYITQSKHRSSSARSKKKSRKKKSRHRSKDAKDIQNINPDIEDEIKIKKEVISDDSLSQMSDLNPPSIATRTRKIKRANSVSSSVYSNGRKTKSEPILITINSDSEPETVSSRPNRSARVRGEMIRKLGEMDHDEQKSGYSSSSSASVHKRRGRPKLLSAKITKAYFSRKNKRHNLKVYAPLKQARRLKIKRIHRRFERKNKKYLPKRSSSRQASLKSFKLSEAKKRKWKRLQEPSESVDPDAPIQPRKLGRPRKKVINSPKVSPEISDIEDDLRKIDAAPDFGKDQKIVLSDTVPKEGDELLGKTNPSRDEVPSKVIGKFSDQRKAQSDYNNIASDLDKIKNLSPDVLQDESDPEREKKARTGLHSRLKGIRKAKASLKRKKSMPAMDVMRRRGRPRLNPESKPHQESNLPSLDAISLLNIKAEVPFLQNSFCFDVTPKIAKCRECRVAVYRTSKRMYTSYCRFMEYRKLCYDKKGAIVIAGFSNPSDATSEHLSHWVPQPQNPPKDLDFNTARSLLFQIGDQFCDLIHQELEAELLHVGKGQKMTWKRIVQGVREMCDVCSTTIFNIHWVCPACGFAVCLDCYKVRKQNIVVEDDEDQPKDRDEFKWLFCSQRNPHLQADLVMAQMIPNKALTTMQGQFHQIRDRLKIPSYCKCNLQRYTTLNVLGSSNVNKQLLSFVCKNYKNAMYQDVFLKKNDVKVEVDYGDLDKAVPRSAQRWLNGWNSNNNNLKHVDDNIFSEESFNLVEKMVEKDMQEKTMKPEAGCFNLDAMIAFGVKNPEIMDPAKGPVKYFYNRYPSSIDGRNLPCKPNTMSESLLLHSKVPHSWFCNGKLLFLHQAKHENNLPIFQDVWRRGQPIVVQGVHEGLDMSLWRPEGFCRDFGEVKNDLVDCKTGAILRNMPMKKFWEGFENFSKRLTDENGDYMLLKLKDWPPGEDFSEKLPSRFKDLMKGLPLPEYTHRDGVLNLAGRLPSSFVRPDLGPKMYNAYGSALFPQKGTTNLHLDVSDAVNVMVYVGIPTDSKFDAHIQEAVNAIAEGGCDSLMRARVSDRHAKPGALWHIYHARDADKIRDLLTKVAIERGEKLEANHDPIHDQSWYLDSELRTRLYKEYGTEGYAIAQCLGDAVFIPAGAPHQVRNLHSCVKVAEDFVSPENIAHCFKLTQEFRNLSDTHTNHEDKLQIKNIIYHVVRDSVSYLLSKDNFTSFD